MIWLNPWAWAGAAGVVLPVLIHLLGRGHARTHRFPTLRFLDASRLLPTQRTRIHDPLLLAVRSMAIVLAAGALARPFLLTQHRTASLDRALARAIVVDTSASMGRFTPAGIRAIDSARHAAATLAASAQTSIIVETNDPARALFGASAWLARQGSRAELVVISDFQRGALDSSDVASVPSEIGVMLHRVPTVSAPVEVNAMANGALVVARATLSAERTDAEWTSSNAPANSVGPAVTVLGGDADAVALKATRAAAATIATPLPIDTSRVVVIVFPGYADRARLLASARPMYAPWMLELLVKLRRDSVHVGASGVASVDGHSRFLVSIADEPGSLRSALAASDANGATSIAPRPGEFEVEMIPDAELARWERPPSDKGIRRTEGAGENTPSDGPWLWIAVLLLLAVEVPLRRAKNAADSASIAEERHAA